LIIKNLPSYISDTRLREHFAQKGTITDARLAHKNDGTSRRFGFVGYKTEAEAVAAKEYFDKTYVDSTRIHVELVDSVSILPGIALPVRYHMKADAGTFLL